jgi:Fe-Mn family superoxide dismutase
VTLTNKELSEMIRRDLGMTDKQVVEEAYVALPKHYELPTEFLSRKSKDAHFELYEEETELLARVSAEIDAVDLKTQVRKYHVLKAEEVSLLNSVYMHELHFANISDVVSEVTVDSLSYMRLARDFGSFEKWQYDFVAAATGHGSGWAVTAYSTFLRRYVNFFVRDHDSSVLLGCYPVVVLDVHEHAYYRDYLSDRRAYVYAMMKELNWSVIEERVSRADKISEVLR